MYNISFASPQKFSNRMKIQALQVFEPEKELPEGERSRNTDVRSVPLVFKGETSGKNPKFAARHSARRYEHSLVTRH